MYFGCTSTTCDSLPFFPMVGQTGIENSVFKDINLYPNPANNTLNIEISTTEDNEVEVNIINMIGQIVLTKNTSVFGNTAKINIDVSRLSDGVYSVEVVLSGEKKYQRAVISR